MTAPADTEPQAPPLDRMRCSDAERLDVVHRLQDAVGRGQLTLDEGTERTQAAYEAKYRGDLPALTADLPQPAPTAPGWRSVASMAALQTRMSLLGAPTWAAADARRRRMVLLLGALLGLLLIGLLTAAAVTGGSAGVSGPHDVGVPPPPWHHWHGYYGDWGRGG